MCGIHGFINGSTKAEVNSDDYVKQGFIAGSLRGMDSSGIAVMKVSGQYNYAKLPLAGMYLPQDRLAGNLISSARNKSTASVCHVRAATSGAINYANAHPFCLEDEENGTIVGVHNGTLTSWKHLEYGKDFDVDSEWAMNHILLKGMKAFEEFTGAFCFVWWTDENPGVLNFARNKDRPMHVAFLEDGNMAYASEAGMLHWLCDRNNIKIVGPIQELEEDKHYAFDIDDPTKFDKKDLPKKPATHYPTTTYSSGNTNTWKSDVAKVKELLANLSNPAPASGTSLISANERDDAVTLGLIGQTSEFLPYGMDDATGDLYGTFEAFGFGVVDAIMRGADDVPWESLAVMRVHVMGVLEEKDRDITVLVSKPHTSKEPQAA